MCSGGGPWRLASADAQLSCTPRSFPGLEKKAKARPAGALYRLLTVADPVLDPVRRREEGVQSMHGRVQAEQ